MVYKCFDKKTSGRATTLAIKNKNISKKELAEELQEKKKIPEKKSTLNFYRQYLGRRSSRYAINK